ETENAAHADRQPVSVQQPEAAVRDEKGDGKRSGSGNYRGGRAGNSEKKRVVCPSSGEPTRSVPPGPEHFPEYECEKRCSEEQPIEIGFHGSSGYRARPSASSTYEPPAPRRVRPPQ